MSKINIIGIINNIRRPTTVYTPIIEAIVNSIEAIEMANRNDGEIDVILKRENTFDFDELPDIKSIEIKDNGIGFNQKHRDSFDTFYSAEKRNIGGKGFGRFMFLKYFNNVRVESIFSEENEFYLRKFDFGKQYDIIINEKVEKANNKDSETRIFLNDLIDTKQLDKGIDTISRKLLEKLLPFFINDSFICPKITIKEEDNGNQIILNEYLKQDNEIRLISTQKFTLESSHSNRKEPFEVKLFKIYYTGNQKSKISLTAHNREVTETSLHNYIPEFEDDFFDEINNVRRNYIIKAYTLGKYLNESVSLERVTFNFEKDNTSQLYEFSQVDIEKQTAEIVKEAFSEDVKVRSDKKRGTINEYVNNQAPWHKPYIDDLDLSKIPFHPTNEKIEIELQKLKYQRETETRNQIQQLFQSENDDFEVKFAQVISKLTGIGKSDLAHYVCNRKVVLELFQELLKRLEDGSSQLEKEIHNLIFPMGKDSKNTIYEDHNLWLLDERLVFSEYIASDKKISNNKDAFGEPDLLIFDIKRSFRNGDNEFSNPLTIFEFKRPKRETYGEEDNPILQVSKYLDKIRAGKYETPEGLEKIKVNENTPVYSYIICDLATKIREFARSAQLTVSPDDEGYFGFHSGYKMYVEIISYKKLLKDANLRNKIFFKKLNLE